MDSNLRKKVNKSWVVRLSTLLGFINTMVFLSSPIVWIWFGFYVFLKVFFTSLFAFVPILAIKYATEQLVKKLNKVK